MRTVLKAVSSSVGLWLALGKLPRVGGIFYRAGEELEVVLRFFKARVSDLYLVGLEQNQSSCCIRPGVTRGAGLEAALPVWDEP